MTLSYDLSTVPAGASVLAELHRLSSQKNEVSSVSKWFGVSPFTPETISWYKGYVGEVAVAETLETLVEQGWLVFHSVPVGSKGSDIDHVLVSPKGNVFTVNTKHHAGKKIWVSEKQVRVNGQVVPYLRNSKHEATRVGKKTGTTVIPVIVFVDPESMDVKPGAEKNHVLITTLKQLKTNLLEADTTHSGGYTPSADFTTPQFWAEKWVNPTVGHTDRVAWVENARKHHRTAQNMRILYGLTVVAAVLIVSYIIFL